MHDLGCDFFDGHLWICPFPSSSLFPFPWACHVRVVLDPVLFRAASRGVFLATRAVHAAPALSREVSPARFCRGSCVHLGSCQVFLCDEKIKNRFAALGSSDEERLERRLTMRKNWLTSYRQKFAQSHILCSFASTGYI